METCACEILFDKGTHGKRQVCHIQRVSLEEAATGGGCTARHSSAARGSSTGWRAIIIRRLQELRRSDEDGVLFCAWLTSSYYK